MSKRLNGWKAIAAFFGRDRTTVARWSRERDLPVHHIPGGKQKSVYALEHELAAWLSRNAGVAEATARQDPLPPAPALPADLAVPARDRRLAWAAMLACAVLALAIFAIARQPAREARAAVHPAIMADYVAARDAWARRTPDDIRHAIQLYEKIIQAAPEFALARAGLAEAWLIYREYGDVSDARAFGNARIAAQKAISLDPDLPGAHRAIGFVDYWWDNDPIKAVREFSRAIELDDKDSQTQFWFANILADLGQSEAAERHYARARLLAPGSQPIAVEHACAQWQAGRDDLALRLMTELKARYPADATISNCLAWVHMGRGDIASFAREFDRMARLRAEPALQRLSAKLGEALRRDPATAHGVLVADARREVAAGTRRIREVPAFYASSMGDRAELLGLLNEAAVLGERWYSPSVTSRIASRWKDDREILALLSRVRVEPPALEGLR